MSTASRTTVNVNGYVAAKYRKLAKYGSEATSVPKLHPTYCTVLSTDIEYVSKLICTVPKFTVPKNIYGQHVNEQIIVTFNTTKSTKQQNSLKVIETNHTKEEHSRSVYISGTRRPISKLNVGNSTCSVKKQHNVSNPCVQYMKMGVGNPTSNRELQTFYSWHVFISQDFFCKSFAFAYSSSRNPNASIRRKNTPGDVRGWIFISGETGSRNTADTV